MRRAVIRVQFQRARVGFNGPRELSLLLKDETALEEDLDLQLLVIRGAQKALSFRRGQRQLLQRQLRLSLQAVSLSQPQMAFGLRGRDSHRFLKELYGPLHLALSRIDLPKRQVDLRRRIIGLRRLLQFADRLAVV